MVGAAGSHSPNFPARSTPASCEEAVRNKRNEFDSVHYLRASSVWLQSRSNFNNQVMILVNHFVSGHIPHRGAKDASNDSNVFFGERGIDHQVFLRKYDDTADRMTFSPASFDHLRKPCFISGSHGG